MSVIKNQAYTFYTTLTSQANTKLRQINPTLAVGDVKVSGDDGALANITTLPTISPAGSMWVKVVLSAAEMNFDNVKIQFVDAAGAEWCDLAIAIKTTVTNPESFKKNTAFNDFEFYMSDSTLHTAKTGLTVTAQRSINGGAFAAMTNAPVEVGNGIYKINLSAADLNGDFITFRFTGAGADDQLFSFKTAP